MRKTTKEEFSRFSQACRRYLKAFGLEHYEVRIVQKRLDEPAYASVATSAQDGCAEVVLNTDFPDHPAEADFFENKAKHEMLHVLLARLTAAAENRFVSEKELSAAEEEVVRRLELLIK